MNDSLQKQKCNLVEKLGVALEQRDQLAPVEARILSYLILTGESGVTFDDLVTNLCASKSTISTHLNHLQDLNRIEYFTKMGDRKKYFVVSPVSFLHKIEAMIAEWKKQKELHQDIKSYKETVNETETENKPFDLDFHNNYILFLDETIKAVTDLKTKIEEKESQNKSA